jgi:pyruvate dehydrogenase E2 component (dihydrolipoamide acetyltransferase)
MPTEVILPKVDMDMTHGTLAVWHVAEGAIVEKGAALFDIETDKAAMEVEAPASGRLHAIAAKPGDRVAVGSVVALILADGEKPVEQTLPAAPAARPAAGPEPSDAPAPMDSAPASASLRATPLARRLARDAGLDLSQVLGSGPRARIQKSDVEAALSHRATAPAGPRLSPAVAGYALPAGPAADAVRGLYADRPHHLVPLDGMRRTVAARLTEAKQTIPHFYLRLDVCLDPLNAVRNQLNTELAPRGIKVSVNDFIIRACARALTDVPEANAVWAVDAILRLETCDIAVAVAVEGGLFVPVLRDAQTTSLTELSAEMKALAARARDRKLAPADYSGGSFAISNLGMFGIKGFDAIINPPQAAILAVGAASLRPVIRPDRSVEAATMMSLTLSVDHRVIDGALGASLIQSIKTHLESPMALLA